MPARDLTVDYLGPALTGLPGRLGLTRAPGLRWPHPGREEEPLADDLRVLRQEHGATLLVTLLTRREAARLGDFKRAARAQGMAWLHLPVPDMEPPESPAAVAKVVTRLVKHLEAGHTAVLHCLAGLGRSGTVAACLLVARGQDAAAAVAAVRAVRPGAIQTLAQEAFVEEYQRWHQGEDGRQPRWRLWSRDD